MVLNYNHRLAWDVIIHPRNNFNVYLTKPPLKLWHLLVITPKTFVRIWSIIHASMSTLLLLISCQLKILLTSTSPDATTKGLNRWYHQQIVLSTSSWWNDIGASFNTGFHNNLRINSIEIGLITSVHKLRQDLVNPKYLIFVLVSDLFRFDRKWNENPPDLCCQES